jgi:hypothetical protein
MTLSKRERYVGIATAAALAILALDRFFLDPLMTQAVELDAETSLAQQDLDRANRLFASNRRLNGEWSKLAGDRLARDGSAAENQVLHSVRDWAQESGLTLSSLKPERTERERGLGKVTVRATGTGGMAQISRFLWHVQTADIPVRLTDVQITTRKEGTDDLSVQLGLATVFVAPEPPAAKPGPRPPQEVQP